jgi:membrane-associated protease RseP (regulator of RpoE activity)
LETADLLLERQPFSFFTSKPKLWLHCSLFALTFFTTSIAGVAWRGFDPNELMNLHFGFEYAALLLFFLSSHEFGHYISARIHRVEATLPFYIPLPSTLFSVGFGTLGAVIRTRSRVPSRRAMFDIGVAGPIAGFIVCCMILAIGFLTLPGIEFLQSIHPGYPHNQNAGGLELAFGKTLVYSLFEKVFAPAGAYIPPMTEMYHYPMLCVGWFGLFVTSLNLLPIGQLDGGHLMYGLFSTKVHRRVGQVTAVLLFAIALPELALNLAEYGAIHLPHWLQSVAVPGGSTWIVWALVTTFVIRFGHPTTLDESPLDTRRTVIGIITICIFILCFTPSPIVLAIR